MVMTCVLTFFRACKGVVCMEWGGLRTPPDIPPACRDSHWPQCACLLVGFCMYGFRSDRSSCNTLVDNNAPLSQRFYFS